MFSTFIAEIGDWQRRVSSPSNEVVIIGYNEVSPLNTIKAFFSACKLTLLCKTMGPVEPQTFRNDYFTPSFVVHYFDSLINSLRVQCHPIAFAPKSQIFT